MSKQSHNSLPSDRMLEMYESMLRIRRFEERAVRFVTEGKLGSTHASIGQEATAVGICEALEDGDQILSTHRGHGHCLAMGTRSDAFMAELLGKGTGTNGGVAGSMHLVDPDVGILGANAIVGGNIPMAIGAAYAAQCQGKGKVVVSFFGEGASSQGGCHEAMNIAGLWKLPIIFVCENNMYAEHTHVSVHVAIENVADRAAGYGFPGVVVDGNNVEEVFQAAQVAVERARAGDGPTLIECKTFRVRGHFEGDPEKYKNQEEQAAWEKKDPLAGLLKRLSSRDDIDRDKIAAIDKKIEAEIAEAARFADQSPVPDPDTALRHVYAE